MRLALLCMLIALTWVTIQSKMYANRILKKNAPAYTAASNTPSVNDKIKRTFAAFPKLLGQLKKLKQNIGYQTSIIEKYIPSILAAALILIISFRALKLWALLRLFSNAFFKLSRLAFFITSLSALAAAYFIKINIWDFPAFFVIPAGFLLIGAFGLYLLDMNFPLWKKIYTSFVFPILSGIGIIFIL